MWYVRKYVRLKGDVLNCVKQFMLDNTKQGTTRIVDLKGPGQPHLCYCLHAKVWLLYFI